MRLTAIVPAAGRGRRLNSTVPKQFLSVGDKPVIIYSLEILDKMPEVRDIVIAGPAGEIDTIRKLISDFRIGKVTDVIEGGEERTQSVREAFVRVATADYVLIHDAVRPFITRELVKRTIDAGVSYGAAISAIPVTDTVKFVAGDGTIVKNVERGGLWLAQTPQVFGYGILSKAYAAYDRRPVETTDEAGLVELTGVKVKVVKGSIFNIKITGEDDLVLAKLIAGMMPARRSDL